MNIFLSLLEQGLIYIPHAIGMSIALLILRIPFLALETAYVLGGIVTSVIPDYVVTLPLIFMLIVLFLIGLGLTSLTIALKYYLNMSYLLISILLWGISYGLNQWIINGSHISLGSKTMLLYLCYSFNDYPQLLMIMSIVLLLSLLFYLFLKTQIGKACMIFGNNNSFFDHFKVSSLYIQWIGLSFAATCSAFSGFLNAYSQGFADINMSSGINMLGITILILGLAILSNQRRHLLIIYMGTFSYLYLQKILLILNVNSRYFISIQAIVIIGLILLMKLYKKGDNNEQMVL